MAPKQKKAAAKKSNKPEPPATSKTPTDTGLARAPFEEGSWRACVSLVVGAGPDEEGLTRSLASAVQQPIREHFALLTWEGVLDKLRQFGSQKGKKVDGLSLFNEHAAVPDAARALLEAGEEIPCELLAKVVKCLLLQAKRQDEQKREQCSDNKAEVDDMDKTERKTKLKRRGEVDITAVMDKPDGGPQLYVLLCGFHQPLLVAELDSLGVHVSAVVRLCSEGSEREEDGARGRATDAELARRLGVFWSELAPVLNSGSTNSRLPDVARLSYTVQNHGPEPGLETGIRIYEGVANLLYDSLEWRRQHQHYLANIRLTDVPAVARVPPRQFSAEVDMRCYGNLLDQVPPECCSVPLILHCMLEQVVVSTEQPSGLPPPPDVSCSDDPVAGVLLERFLPLGEGNEELRDMLRVLYPQCGAAERERLRKKIRAEKAQEKSEQPLLIRHHDDTAHRLRGINVGDGFNPAQVEQDMARLHPLCMATQFRGPRGESAPCWSSVRQHLQHYCADGAASWPQVEHYFHQSVFESMPLTGLDCDGVLERSPSILGALEPAQQPTVMPWDDPPSFANLQLKRKQTQGQTCVAEGPEDTEAPSSPLQGASQIRRGGRPLELADIRSCRLRCLSDRCFTEHHDAAVLSQVLQSACDQSCCLDVFTGRLNNFVYVYCHNPTGPHRHSKAFFDVGLHTDVRFRNYLEHVADTISDWTREEELKREAAEAKDTSPAEPPEDLRAQPEEEEPIIRDGSLKAWMLEQERLQEEEEKAKKPKKGKQPQEAAKVADTKKINSAGQKKEAENVEKGPEPVTTTEPPVEGSAEVDPGEEPVKAFMGLNTGGTLIRVSGCVHHLSPSDGGVVTVENIRLVEASQLVKVVVKKDGHRFCTHIHRGIPNQVKPKSSQQQKKKSLIRQVKQASFTALLQSGVQMSYSCYGPTGESSGDDHRTPETSNHSLSRAGLGPPSSGTQGDTRPPESQGFQKVPEFNSLNLSVPTGLLVRFQLAPSRGGSSQQQGVSVKQWFPFRGAPLPDMFLSEERFRIITAAGDVIRHLRDGSTQALFADGSVIFSSASGPAGLPGAAEEEEPRLGEPRTQRGSWVITTPRGERFHSLGVMCRRMPELLVVTATDPMTSDVMLTREDLVVRVQRSDGSEAVEHADGTRITSWFQDRAADGPSDKQPEEAALTPTSERSGDEDRCTPRGGERKSEGDACQRERVVSVEKEGCATVVVFPERQEAQVLLADGSVVTGSRQGTYEVLPSNGGRLKIHRGGVCTYAPPGAGPAGGAAPEAGTYRMSHGDREACGLTDPHGNLFQVMDNGDVSVRLGPPDQQDPQQDPQQEHLPRLFLVHADGSGVEFLSPRAVEDALRQARCDGAAALQKEALPGPADEFGITILKLGHRSVWSQWMLGKRRPDITPPNLSSRSWAGFPQAEEKTPRPLSGMGFGPETPSSPAPLREDEVVEVRQMLEHRPLSDLDRDVLDARLKDYIEALMSRETGGEDVLHASPEGSASDLLPLYSQRGGAKRGRSLSADASSSVRLAQHLDGRVSFTCSDTAGLSGGPKKSGWPERLRRHRQEVSEDKRLRAALRARGCVPYFHPENLGLRQVGVGLAPPSPLRRSLQEPWSVPDAGARPPPVDRPPLPRSDSSDASSPGTPPRPPRPLSPPPLPSAGGAAGSGGKVDASTQTSADPRAPRHQRSLHVDVTGRPRKTKVRLPASIARPPVGSVPNQKLLSAEAPVRRRCRLTSLSRTRAPTGFQLFPASVDFGVLPEGGSASAAVRMTNVGVDSCRFRVEQPPEDTGLRVRYTPASVPAGLHVDLQVELRATAAGGSEGPRTLRRDLVIQTELEILRLPVSATVLHAPEEQR